MVKRMAFVLFFISSGTTTLLLTILYFNSGERLGDPILFSSRAVLITFFTSSTFFTTGASIFLKGKAYTTIVINTKASIIMYNFLFLLVVFIFFFISTYNLSSS